MYLAIGGGHQQIEVQKMILVASSPFCGSINIRIQWFVSKANIYPEDLDSFLVISAHMDWIQLCPAPPRRFCQLSRGGARPAFCGAGRASLPSTYFVNPADADGSQLDGLGGSLALSRIGRKPQDKKVTARVGMVHWLRSGNHFLRFYICICN